MKLIRYQGRAAVIVMSGKELVANNPGSDLDDHLGLWFGEVDAEGHPIIHTIPAEYVTETDHVSPVYQH